MRGTVKNGLVVSFAMQEIAREHQLRFAARIVPLQQDRVLRQLSAAQYRNKGRKLPSSSAAATQS